MKQLLRARVVLEMFNLFDAKVSDIDYYYRSGLSSLGASCGAPVVLTIIRFHRGGVRH